MKTNDSPRKEIWMGQSEARALAHLLANFPRQYLGIQSPPVITPRTSLRSAFHCFRMIEAAQQGAILVQLGAYRPNGTMECMPLARQDLLLPLVDKFAGDLLLFYSPFFLPVLPALRSRLSPRINATARKGRPANPYVMLSRVPVGNRNSVQRSFQLAVEDIQTIRRDKR